MPHPLTILIVEALRAVTPGSVGERSQLNVLDAALKLAIEESGQEGLTHFLWRAVSEFLSGANSHTVRSYEALEMLCHAAGRPSVKYNAAAIKACMEAGLTLEDLEYLDIYVGVQEGRNYATFYISLADLERATETLQEWSEEEDAPQVYERAFRILSNAVTESKAHIAASQQRTAASEA